MEQSQENFFKMTDKLKNVCKTNNDEWKGDKAFSSTFTLFSDTCDMVDKYRAIQMQSTVSVTNLKNEIQTKIFEKIIFVSNRIQSYANTVGNTELAQKVSYSKTFLNNLSDGDLQTLVKNILTIVTTYLTELADYSLSQTTIDETNALLTEFSTAINQLDALKLDIKNATQNIKKIKSDILDILDKRLDLDIEVYKNSGTDFYAQYQDARIISEIGGRSLLFKMTIKDSVSDNPIKNATVTFTLNGNTEASLVKKSAEKGGLNVTSLAEGKYTVTIKKPGYTTQTITIVIVHGELVKVDILLVKE